MLSTTSKTLLNFSNITFEQQAAISRLFEYDNTLLIASKGFGKCVVAQTAAQEMLAEGLVQRVLVVAPPKVVRLTWMTEHTHWDHLGPVTVLVGTPAQRQKQLLGGGAICVVSAELLPWLVKEPGFKSFDGLIIDEVSRFKAVGGKSFKALRPKVGQFAWRVGLSATPVAEAGEHIYGQALLLDGGGALGRNKDRFLRTYFMSDYMGYDWELQPGGAERLARALGDLVYLAESTEYEDSLPPLHEERVPVAMPDEAWSVYEELAQTMVLEAEDIEAVNEAVLAGKLMQVAAGFVYGRDAVATVIHGEKFAALERLRRKLNEPLVVVYQFVHELLELRQRYPEAVVLADDAEAAQAAWNAGEADMLLVHPRSAGHGLNLQGGGRYMVQLSPIWSADLHDQVVGRIWRRGQAHAVTRYVLVSTGTVDERILDKLAGKQSDEKFLMDHLREVTKREAP